MARQKKSAVNLDRDDGGVDPSCKSRPHVSLLKVLVKRLPRPIDDRVDVTVGAAKWWRTIYDPNRPCRSMARMVLHAATTLHR